MKKALLTTVLVTTVISAYANEKFTGLYTDSGVDSISQLMLLDDQHYCFAVSAGNLDLLTGGTWQKLSQRKDSILIRIKEDSLDLYEIYMTANPQIDEDTLAETQKEFGKQRVLFLTPPALEDALGDYNALLGFSESSAMPRTFKNFYQEGNGSPMYLHIPIPNSAKYIFIGSKHNNKIYRFNIGHSQYAKLNGNPQAGRQPLNMDFTFNIKTNELKDLNNASYGKPTAVPKAQQRKAWEQCAPKKPDLSKTVTGNNRTLLMPDATLLFDQYIKGTITEAWHESK